MSIFAAVLVAALGAAGMASAAEDTTSTVPPGSIPSAKKPPKAVEQTRPKSSELSADALGVNKSTHGYEPGDEKPKGPGEFKFGDGTLHIDADKKDPTPPPGFEPNGQSVLNKAPNEPALQPSYFGLRLTTPIR